MRTAIAATLARTDVGDLRVVADERGLVWVGLPGSTASLDGFVRRHGVGERDAALEHEAARQLADYAAGTRTEFELKLAPLGTPFQLAVWDALLQIPYGQTCSYVDLARRLGRPRASRAVGGANGANPLPLVIPCHRVVATSGLGGYGGGLALKRALLDLERDHG